MFISFITGWFVCNIQNYFQKVIPDQGRQMVAAVPAIIINNTITSPLEQKGNPPSIPPPLFFVHGKRCNLIQIESIAAQEPTKNSYCPNTKKWMSSLLSSAYNNPSATLISVGCNRGDDLLLQIREWSRNSSYSLQSMIHEENKWFFSHRSCPLDSDMEIDEHFIRPVNGFCIEPMHSTFDFVDKIIKELGWDAMVHVIHAAVSSTPGTVQFPIDHRPGVEHLGIGSTAEETEFINVITIDELVEKNAIETIDVLSIDTEGNDMRVIFGAVKSLSKVRYLEFEYHHVNRWARSDLQDLVDLLDQFGFDCFWPGNTGQLWRLTGCWHDSYYTKKSWSNVACANRKEEKLLQTMEALAELNM